MGKIIFSVSGIAIALLMLGGAMRMERVEAKVATPDASQLIWQVKEALEKNPKTLGCDGSACEHDIAGMFVLSGRRPAAIVVGQTSHGPCMTCEVTMSFFRFEVRRGKWKLAKADLAFMSTNGGSGRWQLLHRARKGDLLVFRQFNGNQGYMAEILDIYVVRKNGPHAVGTLCGGRSNRHALKFGGSGKLVDWQGRLRIGKGGALRLEVVDSVARRRTSLSLVIRGGKLLVPEGMEPRLRLDNCGW